MGKSWSVCAHGAGVRLIITPGPPYTMHPSLLRGKWSAMGY
eukprot:SAG31_NODE_4880_length_2887_cov_3.746413_3_plen_41_part_00